MKVSVIIPVYNVSEYIERCLLSVLNQTWQDLEIIVVDDCTPDDSMAIVRRIAETHLRGNVIKCFAHEQNKGQSAARNLGIKASIGDFIYFLDSDDYIPVDSISNLMLYAETQKYDFVLGNYEIKGKFNSILYTKMTTGAIDSNTTILRAYASDILPRTVWNMLLKRSFLLSENLFFEEGLIHEDDLWTFMLVCKAQSAFILNKTTYYYYTHFNSTTGNPTLWNLECRVRIIQLMYDYISASKIMQQNKYVYLTFEEAKAKYFDRILFYTKDKTFQFNSYKLFRAKRYFLPKEVLLRSNFDCEFLLRSLHYRLPLGLGFLYFKYFIKISYCYLILKIKMKQLLLC